MDSIPWDSSPLNHHLGEYVLELFPSVFSSKSKFCRNTLDFVLKVDDMFSILYKLVLTERSKLRSYRVYLKAPSITGSDLELYLGFDQHILVYHGEYPP